jgi:predicted ATP-grasp superfamily ATP-dependent carboligase
VTLPPEAVDSLRRAYEALAGETPLRGLIGIDFVWGPDRRCRLVEVNPRYTASMELLELVHGRALLREHLRVCLREERPGIVGPRPSRDAASPVLGKLILYADAPLRAPDLSRWLRPRSPWAVPFLADLPAAGTVSERGQPVCTVFAGGHSAEVVREKLRRRGQRVRTWFERL